jgi:hypothetical protein
VIPRAILLIREVYLVLKSHFQPCIKIQTSNRRQYCLFSCLLAIAILVQIVVFWVVTPGGYRRFGVTSPLRVTSAFGVETRRPRKPKLHIDLQLRKPKDRNIASILYCDDGGSMFLWTIHNHLQHYTLSWTRRPPSELPYPWNFKSLSLKRTHRADDGGSTNLWNVGKFVSDYTALQPRRAIFLHTAVRTSNPTHCHCSHTKPWSRETCFLRSSQWFSCSRISPPFM